MTARSKRCGARFAPKVTRLEEQKRKAQEQVDREQQQVGQQKLQTAVSLGATMLGALMGRRAVSLRRSGARRRRSRRRSVDEGRPGRRTRQGKLQEVEAEIAALNAELEREIAALEATADVKRTARCDRDQAQAGQRGHPARALAWQPFW